MKGLKWGLAHACQIVYIILTFFFKFIYPFLLNLQLLTRTYIVIVLHTNADFNINYKH